MFDSTISKGESRAVGAATVTTVLTVPLFGLSSDMHA